MIARLPLTLTLILLMAGFVSAQTITISQAVDKTSVAFEDSVVFEITLQWDGPQTAYLFDKPLNPTIDRMKVRGFSSSISSLPVADGEITTKKFRFVLIPVTAGIGQIAPVNVSFVSRPDSLPGQLVTEAMTVNIASPLPVEVEEEGVSLIWWMVAAVIILAGGAFLVHRVNREREPVLPEKSPVEKLLEDLKPIQGDTGGDMKKFQTELYKILVSFIKAELKIDAASLEVEQLEEEMRRAGLEENRIKRICSWLSRAEQDKFRPVSAGPGESIRLEAEIREFFEKW